MQTAYLILADGTLFEGKSIGASGMTIGETVFTTGMTGYIETLTDPSYYGQIVTQTFPLIGNYGVMPQDFESSKSWVRGYVVRELCDQPSNFRCGGTLSDFLKSQNIIGICGIDTRALTKRLRESGVMNGMIISGVDTCPAVTEELLKEIKAYKIEQAVESVQQNTDGGVTGVSPVERVATNEVGAQGETSPSKSIVLWDFGAKANIQRELEKRGCRVKVVPCTTTADEILALKPDGLMLSNGPGDPADNVQIIEELKKICEYDKQMVSIRSSTYSTTEDDSTSRVIPIFGICLGHQMLALARGCKTSKLKYGHRGGNHPCKDTETGRVYITSQNHGYAVENASLPSYAKMSFFNVNDGTVEGITYTDIPAFSVQFHPEACGGPHDTNFLFDRFMSLINIC
ncbi:carbamoyl-phosphate synthase small subunit [Treponema bryantii]|uniref:Carbamoyl phosphate synthase small chain n=1 Tax=Treponema bryantii TaxID=163 RepID=A0A1I3I8Q8_9SPIR|nr:carbamoyl phosphate synthase small subunit [Treponema bryantii]SFI44378.1 carbamoyl-phosphate synthase small subunit [Treponema bryantii]